jgi:hypothetical protein
MVEIRRNFGNANSKPAQKLGKSEGGPAPRAVGPMLGSTQTLGQANLAPGAHDFSLMW